jgi:hypothetical protein
LGIRLEAGAYAETDGAQGAAKLGMRTDDRKRDWLYDVDHRRGVLIRVGNQDTPPATIAQRENALGLPPLSAPNQPPVQPARPASRGRTWVGAGVSGGSATYSDSTQRTEQTQSSSSDGNCSGSNTIKYTTTTARDRKAIGGWGEVEREIPVLDHSVVWLGGRAGVASEAEKTTVTSDDPLVTGGAQDGGRQSYYAQLWAEYEHPNVAVGLGLVGAYSPTRGTEASPGFHLRAGHPRIGLDVGYLDRMSYLGYQSGHLGASIAVPRGSRIENPDDVVARIFIGAYTFPGARLDLFNVSPGVGAQIFFTPRLAIGFDVAGYTNGIFGGLHLRSAFGP